jgi:hypothetical protein
MRLGFLAMLAHARRLYFEQAAARRNASEVCVAIWPCYSARTAQLPAGPELAGPE